MINELLCKAKEKNNGDWVFGTPVKVNDKFYMILGATEDAINTKNSVDFFFAEIDPKTICRKTGFKDHDRKKDIFEKDKVMVFWSEYGSWIPEGFTGTVEMICGSWMVHNESERVGVELFQELASWVVVE